MKRDQREDFTGKGNRREDFTGKGNRREDFTGKMESAGAVPCEMDRITAYAPDNGGETKRQ